MSVWMLLAVLAAVSFCLRTVVLLAVGSRELPPFVDQVGRHLPVAIFVAMVTGGLWASALGARSSAERSEIVARLAALAIAATVAHPTQAPGRSLLAGLAAFFAVRAVLG